MTENDFSEGVKWFFDDGVKWFLFGMFIGCVIRVIRLIDDRLNRE